MDVFEVIKNRRSTRDFLDKEISDEVISELLEAARLAPSGGNGQNWIFGVVKDKEMKVELAKAAGEQMWISKAPVVIVCCAKIDDDLKNCPEDDFGLIVNYTRFGKEFVDYMNAYDDRKMAKTFWNNGVPATSGEHILLTAFSKGIRGCWVGYLDLRKVNKLLNLPDDITSLYLMPIGYPRVDPKPIDRKPLEEIVFYEKWKD